MEVATLELMVFKVGSSKLIFRFSVANTESELEKLFINNIKRRLISAKESEKVYVNIYW